METKTIQKRASKKIGTDKLYDPMWRLSNLYWIQNKKGETVLFQPNEAQRYLYDNFHPRSLILKARQLGFSTAVDILLLDSALFYKGFHAGIVADTEETAQDLFRTKVQFPYEHLPPSVQNVVNLITANKSSYEFTTGSSIETGVTLRSGTFQAVHVSEFAKISVEHPDRAKEIITGTLETVPIDGIAFIESTARGRGGKFYDYYKQSIINETRTITDLDYKLFFFSWFKEPEYTLNPDGVVIEKRLKDYFKTLGVDLSAGQMAWYAKKEETLGDDMKREYPSTPDEAFEQSMEGSYFAKDIMKLRKAGKITKIPVDPILPVQTHWDLGHHDYMAIVFTQRHGKEMRVIDYFESNQSGFPFYAQVLRERKYNYSEMHNAPHDIQVTELSGKTRLEMAKEVGIRFNAVPRIQDKADAIEMAHKALRNCAFDEERCGKLISHLEDYHKAWDTVNGIWKPTEAKSEHNHAADAFMTMAQAEEWPADDNVMPKSDTSWKTKRKKF